MTDDDGAWHVTWRKTSRSKASWFVAGAVCSFVLWQGSLYLWYGWHYVITRGR